MRKSLFHSAGRRSTLRGYGGGVKARARSLPILKLPEVELFYQERGAGRPALFVHGFALDHTMWLDELSGLAGLRRCIAIDLRGSGRSHIGLEPGRAGDYHIADALAAIELLGEGRVDLVGHSMGAHIGFAIAARAPEKVRSLALFGAMKREEYRFAGTRSEDALRRPKEELAQRFAGGMLASGASLLVRARALAMVMTIDWSLVFPEAGPESAWIDQGTALGMPMLLSTGAEDEITPPAAVARLAAAHPGATFVEIARAGHLAPVENPDAVNSALAAFWDR